MIGFFGNVPINEAAVYVRTKSDNGGGGICWGFSLAKPCPQSTLLSAPDVLDSITVTHRDAEMFPLLVLRVLWGSMNF